MATIHITLPDELAREIREELSEEDASSRAVRRGDPLSPAKRASMRP
jgi:hypothetical protein